jgi:small subunit ribosomal protein S17
MPRRVEAYQRAKVGKAADKMTEGDMAETSVQASGGGAKAEVRHRQEKVGIVTRTKMQKTVLVEVSRRVPHPLYKRIVTRRSRFLVHDEEGRAQTGDMVRIIETRPMSRHKRWRLGEIVQPSSTRGV